ncbi:MAG: hypothetical protein GEU88_17525 [Solirubrobacterales bacterium]|nr:hypothetical protein [Solirubrobacterales bacterium]
MVDLLERIGPYLGIAAFLGLAILAFLIFQQAREVRRLREWAGRAPERAADADEATQAAAEARGESRELERIPPGDPGPLGGWWQRVRATSSPRAAALNRRLPVDPRYLLAGLAAVIVAAAVLTSGFGLIGGDGDADEPAKPAKQKKVEVAVLNGTQTVADDGTVIGAVSGLAAEVADRAVKSDGFKPGKEADAASGLQETTIFFEPGHEPEANALAREVAGKLGETPVTPMIEEVRERAGKARLAIVIGLDDEEFGNAGASSAEG